MKRATLLAVSVLASAALVTGCSTTDPEPADTTPEPIVTETPEPIVTETPEPVVTEVAEEDDNAVVLECKDYDSGREGTYAIERTDTDVDFSEVWADQWRDGNCETEYVPPAERGEDGRAYAKTPPETAVEVTAYGVSGYDGNSVSTLYTLCAVVDPDDYYVSNPDLSEGQKSEAEAMLVLCPGHPLADEIQASIDGAVAEAEPEHVLSDEARDLLDYYIDSDFAYGSPEGKALFCGGERSYFEEYYAESLAGVSVEDAQVWADEFCAD